MKPRRSTAALLTWLLVASSSAFAQQPAAPDTTPKGWILKAKAGVALTQSSFTKNWSGGEVGTVSWLSSTDFLADRQLHPKANFHNALVLAFGQTHQQDAERRNWLAPSKSADKIEYDGVVRFTLGQWLDPYVSGTFDSQFLDKRPNVATKALNPFLLGESAGLARAFYDQERRQVVSRLGFALRQRIDRLATDALGNLDTEITNDGGLEWQTNSRLATAEDRTVYKSELRAFKAFFTSQASSGWSALDVRWQNTLSNKLYKFLSVDLYLEYLYDKQLDKAGQLKQTLGMGLTWQLI